MLKIANQSKINLVNIVPMILHLLEVEALQVNLGASSMEMILHQTLLRKHLESEQLGTIVPTLSLIMMKLELSPINIKNKIQTYKGKFLIKVNYQIS